jgi:hypothetical protein
MSEQVTISAWPRAAGTNLVIARSATGTGTIVSDNPTLTDGNAVLLILRVSWTGAGNRPRVRETATVIANGGMGR